MPLDLAIFAALNRSIAAPVPPTLERSGFLGDRYELQELPQQTGKARSSFSGKITAITTFFA